MKKIFCKLPATNICKRGMCLLIFVFLSIMVVMGGCSQQDTDESHIKDETIVSPTKEIVSTAPLATDLVTEEVTSISLSTEAVTEQIIETESPTENTFEKYLGTWSNVDGNGQGFTVTFSSIDGNDVECYMCRTAPNAAHIAMTDKVCGQIEDNKVYFDFTDSFMNCGNGVLTLNEETIHINAMVTEFYQPYLYAFLGEGELVKISDSTKNPYL